MTGVEHSILGQFTPWPLVGLPVAAAVLLGMLGGARRTWLPVAAVNALAVAVYIPLAPTGWGLTQHITCLASATGLGWALVAMVLSHVRVRRESVSAAQHTAHLSAVLLTVGAASILAVVLCMRGTLVLADLINGYPYLGIHDYGFGPEGMWSLLMILLTCAVSWIHTRHPRVLSYLFWTIVALSTWGSLLWPVYRFHASGGYERTESTLMLMLAWTAILVSFVMVARMLNRKAVLTTGRGLPLDGFRRSCVALGIGITFLVCYHLLVPLAMKWGGFRVPMSSASTAAALSATALFLLLDRLWSDALAETAMGLASLSLCGFASLVVPVLPLPLADQYPMIFNAMIVGLALATGLCGALTTVWTQHAQSGRLSETAERLIPFARRFAFINAALAILIAVAMTLWPRIPTVATTDDSMGRVLAGMGGNLFLLLVMLWCSRRLNRLTFHLLTVLAVFTMCGFLVVRMLPFRSAVG